MMPTASIQRDNTAEHARPLTPPCSVYAGACNRLVSGVREYSVWNRVALHRDTYLTLR
ncbi:hypothetical protein MPNT_90008 [Candidatus Methylacidithermus pantelleriae]|uniref:Uncharacterized protein n=2 Tax=Candidatus Methylacidithermus pantelleriae TaxID=2744239 RepID=A0A8J2BR52_9BACT|nr:hypothetical protein MPNT_90008 [Candidatus Methylacidithermus pantelleriae]